MNKILYLTKLFFLIPLCITTGYTQNDQAITFIEKLEKTYMNAKMLSFDGNIKYYTEVNSNSPIEIMMISYRREGKKIHIVIGDQTVVYDGKMNIVINESEKKIYVSSNKPPKNNKLFPAALASDYLKTGMFNLSVEDYLGDKRRITLTEKDKTVSSSIVFISQKNTNFIEFARMIIDKEDEEANKKINKKKFEFSYYNYKTVFSEFDKIDVSKYVIKVKKGKITTYKALGQLSNFQIIVI